jgi:hypothetical protein
LADDEQLVGRFPLVEQQVAALQVAGRAGIGNGTEGLVAEAFEQRHPREQRPIHHERAP